MLDSQANMRQLTNIELIRKAEDCVDNLKLEKAVSLYDEGVRRFPNDTLIMDQYTDLLIQLGETEKAKQLIERSIQLNPAQEGQKYMSLAEMLCGAEAVQMYKQGIQVLTADQERHRVSQNQAQEFLCQKQIAAAHASIAESYMTEPLCDDSDAEQQCETNLQQALALQENNLDALQTMAQLRLLRKRDGDAKALLERVVARTLEIIAQNAEEQSLGSLMGAGQVNAKPRNKNNEPPSIEFRMQTSRFLTELAMWRESMKILEGVVGDDDECIEAWYLLAFALFRLKKYATAEECCTNVKNLAIKFKVVNPELEAGTREIYEELMKHKAKK